jgi:hypothetical protein
MIAANLPALAEQKNGAPPKRAELGMLRVARDNPRLTDSSDQLADGTSCLEGLQTCVLAYPALPRSGKVAVNSTRITRSERRSRGLSIAAIHRIVGR